jgi:serine/threonine protein kinase
VSGDLRGEWDADRLEQVVSNLVGNAIQHGNGTPINPYRPGQGNAVRLTVHDGGPPIPPEVLPYIFEPLARGGAEGASHISSDRMRSSPPWVREGWAKSTARDIRVDRDVAIKILPEAFAADADRVARFQREAKTFAALNHPNIAQILGLEQATWILAVELVAGENLSDRIARGPIPIDEALPIAKQIAEALEAATNRGSFTAI